jgi:hypothetical protein
MNTTGIKIGPRQIAIILLTLGTAGIHLSLLFPDPLFILNGLGYIALLLAYFLPLPYVKDNRGLVRWVYMGYALVTILAWIIMGSKNGLGYTAKAIEVVLIIMLWFDR